MFDLCAFIHHRDCIRFAFMEVLQEELDEITQSWNTHLLQRRRGGISGIPDELYNIPDLYGRLLHFLD